MHYEFYETYLNSPEWQSRATAAKDRAGWKCSLCSRRRGLEVHHNTYDRLGQEDPTDLVVLCSRCHRTHHGTLMSKYGNTNDQPFLPFIATEPDVDGNN